MMMMASPIVDSIGKSPENFLDCTSYTSYGWLSPRISFSRDFVEEGSVIHPSGSSLKQPEKTPGKLPEKSDHDDPVKDFEFCLEDPVTMLPADQLFYDGKLVPLQLSKAPLVNDLVASTGISLDSAKSRRRMDLSCSDPYLFSPKAPRCSSRWRELLGLKKIHQNPKPELQKSSAPSKNPKLLKHFLRVSSESKTTNESSLNLPLLSRDSEEQSVSISSRLSLSSSSSSGPDHEDLPRFSLDSDKSSAPPLVIKAPPRVKVALKQRSAERPFSDQSRGRAGRSPMRRASDSSIPIRGVSVDSPRMNSSGKIVFQSLERSSSSPSSFNGGSRSGKDYNHYRHRENWRGMERSYSANVRVTPVLNVPVCSLSSKGAIFGLGQLFSQQKNTVKTNNRGRNDRL